MEREAVNLEADLISAKNQYDELKRQSLVNSKELEHQIATEHRLRKDLNRNLNQDLDLKRDRDRVNFLKTISIF